jgi:YegS/Rv2252/BmrU family lipid kinase
MNPVSGTNSPESVRQTIESTLEEHNLTFEVYETSGNEDLKEIIRRAAQNGFRIFLSAGGDGTIAALANALTGTDIPFVIIPNGTWNGLARSLEIPLQIDQALNLMFQEHEIREIDALEVDGQFYLLNVSAGLGSRAMTDVNREDKRRLGIFYDLWNAFNQLMGFQTFRFEVKVDGALLRFRASEVMVANCRNIALKSVQLDPEIRMDDGKMHLCRIQARSVRDYFGIAFSMIAGKQQEDWRFLCLDATQEVEIRCNHRLPVQADGDLIGYLPIKVKLARKAVRIVTPIDAQP